MENSLRSRIIAVGFLAFVAAGCGPPPVILVETAVHPDGSCDRMIWQPRGRFLPAQALLPTWNARWKSIAVASRRPKPAGFRASDDQYTYFIARGTFPSPREIPPHYRYSDEKVPDAGVSELERTYERKEYGFVVEHLWREKITNIVSLTGFLKGRDELLDVFLPVCTDAIEKVLGTDYDVSRLVTYVRADVRRFLENASVLWYDAAVRRRVIGEDGKFDDVLTTRLLEEAERIGLDRKVLVEMFKCTLDEKERERTGKAFLGHLAVQYLRHRDGAAVTAAEADALIEEILKGHRYEAAIREQAKRWEDPLKGDKKLEKRLMRALVGMVGLYAFPFSGAPEFEFTVRLPGELVETNGTGNKGGRTRWKFDTGDLFPDGFEMKARSIVIDRDGQKKVLGRVVIDDETRAMEFMELAGGEGTLLEAVRKVRQTGDRNALSQVKTSSPEESLRIRKLHDILFKP